MGNRPVFRSPFECGFDSQSQVIIMTERDGAAVHRDLIAQGWQRRFTIEEPRLTEMKESYEALGLEVRIETGIPDEAAECTDCFTVEGFAEKYKTIYTRGKEQESAEAEDMFE